MVGVSLVLMFMFFFSAEYCYAEQETVKSEKAEKYHHIHGPGQAVTMSLPQRPDFL